MIYKEEDVQNKVRVFKSSIYAIQETHYKRKGKFKMHDFKVFESIQKNKENGGTMLGIHTGLQPGLASEYSDRFYLIVVEVQIGNKSIRVITGYGPQKSWDSNEIIPFFTALEAEIVSAELEGKSVIISIDANANLDKNMYQMIQKKSLKMGKYFHG